MSVELLLDSGSNSEGLDTSADGEDVADVASVAIDALARSLMRRRGCVDEP